MIEFEEKFFRDEIRDGFYVDSATKCLWAADLEVLAEIDRICRKRKIPYFISSGTLLGAVRHNGFIPWDDDLDIVMFRKDYMRFLKVVREELPSSFVCYDLYHDEIWIRPFARIANTSNLIDFDREFLERSHGCPIWAGVDVFVFDEQPESKEEFYLNTKLTRGLCSFIDLWNKNEGTEETCKVEEMISTMEKLFGVTFDRQKNIRHQVLRLIDGLWASHNNGACERMVTCYFVNREYYHSGYKKEWFRESIELPFEGIMVPAPIGFHEVLKQTYGIDYLFPARFGHNVNRELYRVKQKVENNIRIKKDRLKKLEKLMEDRRCL